MKVYGQEVPQLAFATADSVVKESRIFRADDLVEAVRAVVHPSELHAYRFVDRYLQREKKAGHIQHIGDGNWSPVSEAQSSPP